MSYACAEDCAAGTRFNNRRRQFASADSEWPRALQLEHGGWRSVSHGGLNLFILTERPPEVGHICQHGLTFPASRAIQGLVASRTWRIVLQMPVKRTRSPARKSKKKSVGGAAAGSRRRPQPTTLKHGKARRPASSPGPAGHAAEIGVLPGSARSRLLERFLADLEKPLRQRLRVAESIAAGGMGAINTAEDLVLNREVAKKTIHPHLRLDRRALFLFMREAQITGQLDHPHIVPVHEVGRDPDGCLFFTMKRVSGRTLADQYGELAPGPIPRDALLNLLGIFLKVCDAVAFAHSRGVIHCDLKPDNVMVGDFGQVYVMDWGIARVRKETKTDIFLAPGVKKAAVVSTFSVMGTPAYMSPEQTLGERSALDERTDVFSLGAVLYELFAGRPPYGGSGIDDTFEQASVGDWQPLSQVSGARVVPIGLERIIHKAMAVDRGLRFGSVNELKNAVERYLREGAEFPVARFCAGTVIIREGDAGDAAYIIAHGRCEVCRTRAGQTESLRVMGPGEIVGETALLSPGPRTADVVALEDSELFVISKAYLEAELAYMKPWLANMLRTVAERFRDVDNQRRANNGDR